MLGGGEQGPRSASLGKGCAASMTAAWGWGRGAAGSATAALGEDELVPLSEAAALVEGCAGSMTAAQGGAR